MSQKELAPLKAQLLEHSRDISNLKTDARLQLQTLWHMGQAV